MPSLPRFGAREGRHALAAIRALSWRRSSGGVNGQCPICNTRQNSARRDLQAQIPTQSPMRLTGQHGPARGGRWGDRDCALFKKEILSPARDPYSAAGSRTEGTRMSTIALVDDDRNILTSVSIALEAENYRITTYSDGFSALEGFKASPPDLAVLDIKMPRMDGMELLRRIRQKFQIPVIFLTSKEEEIDELCGFKLGADDFIRKPFSQRVLIERIKVL